MDLTVSRVARGVIVYRPGLHGCHIVIFLESDQRGTASVASSDGETESLSGFIHPSAQSHPLLKLPTLDPSVMGARRH